LYFPFSLFKDLVLSPGVSVKGVKKPVPSNGTAKVVTFFEPPKLFRKNFQENIAAFRKSLNTSTLQKSRLQIE